MRRPAAAPAAAGRLDPQTQINLNNQHMHPLFLTTRNVLTLGTSAFSPACTLYHPPCLPPSCLPRNVLFSSTFAACPSNIAGEFASQPRQPVPGHLVCHTPVMLHFLPACISRFLIAHFLARCKLQARVLTGQCAVRAPDQKCQSGHCYTVPDQHDSVLVGVSWSLNCTMTV
jgi:hypothetical protein